MINTLHRFASNPWIYEWIQFFFGAPIVHRRLRAVFRRLPPTGVCVDIGGGTGLFHRKVISAQPNEWRYVCLDLDVAKLRALRTGPHHQAAIIGDAGRLPLRSRSLECAVLMAVTHHIPPDQLETVIAESMRILKDDGRLLFLDALWKPSRLVSRLLWKLDRGSFPHTEETLLSTLRGHGEIVSIERYQIYHRYVICLVTPKRVTSPPLKAAAPGQPASQD